MLVLRDSMNFTELNLFQGANCSTQQQWPINCRQGQLLCYHGNWKDAFPWQLMLMNILRNIAPYSKNSVDINNQLEAVLVELCLIFNKHFYVTLSDWMFWKFIKFIGSHSWFVLKLSKLNQSKQKSPFDLHVIALLSKRKQANIKCISFVKYHSEILSK